jgi:DNA-3-methyladenine glycosylase II
VNLPPAYWNTAKAELAAHDAVLGRIIAAYPADQYLTGRGDAFHTLMRSIVGQQISVKAADAVWTRLESLTAIEPQAMLVLDEQALRGAGLSRQKVKYVHAIARGFVDGTVHPSLWQNWKDEQIITELVKLPGIGRWTAEMFLIFHLLRPDVLPLADLGLLKAFEMQHQKPREQLAQYAECWQPYRTVATWYLWRSLDPVVVAY